MSACRQWAQQQLLGEDAKPVLGFAGPSKQLQRE
jgi:hypothetical protein